MSPVSEEESTNISHLFVGHHLIEYHERVLGCQQTPQVLVLATATLLVAHFLHYKQKRGVGAALKRPL